MKRGLIRRPGDSTGKRHHRVVIVAPRRARLVLVMALVGASLLAGGLGLGAAWAQEEIFVTNSDTRTVTVYNRTANGDVAPLRMIGGPATKLGIPYGIAVDSAHGEVFVANSASHDSGAEADQSITVYGLGATGDITPLRVIAGPTTGLASPAGIALDAARGEIIVANRASNSVTVYGRTASGDATPVRVLVGPDSALDNPWALALDTVNNELWVSNYFGGINVYSRTASGDAKPLRTLNAAGGPGFTVDPTRDEVVVGNFQSVDVYGRTATGSAAPVRSFDGLFVGPGVYGVVVDPVNNEIVLADVKSAIAVFRRTATGPTSALRVITGDATQLFVNQFLSVTTSVTCSSSFHLDFG